MDVGSEEAGGRTPLPQIFPDYLTLYQPEGTNYDHQLLHVPLIFRSSDIPVWCLEDKKNCQKNQGINFNTNLTPSHEKDVCYGNTGCGVFKRGGIKLERFLPQNPLPLNFENWTNGEPQ